MKNILAIIVLFAVLLSASGIEASRLFGCFRWFGGKNEKPRAQSPTVQVVAPSHVPQPGKVLQPISQPSSIIDLFDLLDSNKDGFIKKDDLDLIKKGKLYTELSSDVKEEADIKLASGEKINKDAFRLSSSTTVDLWRLNNGYNYSLKTLISVLGISDSQAVKICGGDRENVMTPAEVAAFIKGRLEFKREIMR